MGLLSGLDALGLGNLDKADIFEKEKDTAKKKTEEDNSRTEPKEQDYLFDKTYCCPICDSEFKTRTVRANKAHLLGTDLDLRPRHEHIDTIKYDTVVCPYCGYAALTRYFKGMTSVQSKLIQSKICINYKGRQPDGDVYTYEQALERYKLVLANAVVKKAKASEKAYICLKSAWILRGMQETLDQEDHTFLFKKASYEKSEKEYLQNALEGFLEARQSENLPICGMDEATLDFLIAVLAMNMEQYDTAMNIVGNLLTSPRVNGRVKDKVREVKKMISDKVKAEQSE